METKFAGRSARVWTAITGILGIIMPFLGLDPTEGIPLLDVIGQQGLATLAAGMALVHFVRPSEAKLTAKP